MTVTQRCGLAPLLHLLLVLLIGLFLGLAGDNASGLMLENALKDARFEAVIIHILSASSSRCESVTSRLEFEHLGHGTNIWVDYSLLGIMRASTACFPDACAAGPASSIRICYRFALLLLHGYQKSRSAWGGARFEVLRVCGASRNTYSTGKEGGLEGTG